VQIAAERSSGRNVSASPRLGVGDLLALKGKRARQKGGSLLGGGTKVPKRPKGGEGTTTDRSDRDAPLGG
jgi:hypothetical protein